MSILRCCDQERPSAAAKMTVMIGFCAGDKSVVSDVANFFIQSIYSNYVGSLSSKFLMQSKRDENLCNKVLARSRDLSCGKRKAFNKSFGEEETRKTRQQKKKMKKFLN